MHCLTPSFVVEALSATKTWCATTGRGSRVNSCHVSVGQVRPSRRRTVTVVDDASPEPPGVRGPGPRRRSRSLAGSLAALVALAAAGWFAAGQIKSPAQIAAEAQPPPASPITVPVERRVLSTRVIVRGTARFGGRAGRARHVPAQAGQRDRDLAAAPARDAATRRRRHDGRHAAGLHAARQGPHEPRPGPRQPRRRRPAAGGGAGRPGLGPVSVDGASTRPPRPPWRPSTPTAATSRSRRATPSWTA